MAEKPRFTRWQQAAVDDRGGTLLVSAAAGSGKTSVLTSRVVSLLADETAPVSPEELLIVTFTNAAAAEMKQRIYTGLAAEIAARPGSAFLRRQQALVSRADICTIDSFCIKLVREHFSALGIRRDFSIVEGAQAGLLKQRALGETLQELYEEAEPAFLQMAELVNAERSDRRLEDILLKLHDFLQSLPYPQNWLDSALALYDGDRPAGESVWGRALLAGAAEMLSFSLAQLEKMGDLAAGDGKLVAALAPVLESDRALVQGALDAALTGDLGGLEERLRAGGFARFPTVRGYADDPLKVRVKELRDEVRADWAEWRDKRLCRTPAQHREDVDALRPLVAALYGAVSRFGRKLEERKRAENQFEFSDLEQYALRLCTTTDGVQILPSELAGELSSTISFIMVDEYQDTNGVQDALFQSLSKNGENLFLVGDVKQSIYRFRQAKPEIFIAKKEQFHPYDGSAYPALITLGQNFRSAKGVTDFVNFLFSRVMSREVGEIPYGEGEELVYSGGYDGAAVDDAPEIYLVDGSPEQPGEGEEPPPPDRRTLDEREADFVAQKIRSMVEGGFLVKDGPVTRPARYGDFAVLLRSANTLAPLYLERLELAGVPAGGSGSQGFLGRKEIGMLTDLLKCIDNPKDDVALAGAMLSPLYGFTPDELAEIRAGAPKGAGKSLYARLLGAARTPKLDGFLKDLRYFRELAAVLPARELLGRIYLATDVENLVSGLANPAPRRENLRLFLTYAQEFSQSGSAREFLRYLERVAEGGDDLPGAQSGGGGNGVQVMSIHRSKGLEFPVCFVSRLGGGYNLKDARARAQVSPAMGFTCYRRREHFLQHSTLMHEAAKWEAVQQSLSEEMRVLYVALTRAKQKLILTAAQKDPQSYARACWARGTSPYAVRRSGCFADFVLAALAQHPGADGLFRGAGVLLPAGEAPFPLVAAVVRPALPAPRETAREEVPADPAQVARLREKLAYQYPYRALTALPAKASVSQLAKGRKSWLNTRPVFTYQGGLTPTERGNAHHKFMQYCDYRAAAVDPEGEIARLRGEQYLTGPEADCIDPAVLRSFFAGPVGRRIARADRLYRELRFFTRMDAGELDGEAAGFGETVLVQGVADCVLEEGGELTIIDYKTDRVKDLAALGERYAVQLQVYTKGIGDLLEKPVRHKILYSFYLQKALELE